VDVRAIFLQAFRLRQQGKSQTQASAELEKIGLDAETATKVVARVDEYTKAIRDAYRQSRLKSAGIGALWCVGGIVVTLVTLGMAGRGGTYVVAWGAVWFGLVQAIRGLIRSQHQPTEDDLLCVLDSQ
jgi:hypothetical protein